MEQTSFSTEWSRTAFWQLCCSKVSVVNLSNCILSKYMTASHCIAPSYRLFDEYVLLFESIFSQHQSTYHLLAAPFLNSRRMWALKLSQTLFEVSSMRHWSDYGTVTSKPLTAAAQLALSYSPKVSWFPTPLLSICLYEFTWIFACSRTLARSQLISALWNPFFC